MMEICGHRNYMKLHYINEINLQQIQLSSVPGRFTKKIWASKRLPSLPLVMRTCNEDGASVVCDTSAKWAKRCWSSGQMNCRKGKSFADAWAPEKRYLRKYHRAIHSICYLWTRVYIYISIYLFIHAEKCKLNQIYWLAYVSSKKWENMITPSHKKLVKVGLMMRTSQESPHFLCMFAIQIQFF